MKKPFFRGVTEKRLLNCSLRRNYPDQVQGFDLSPLRAPLRSTCVDKHYIQNNNNYFFLVVVVFLPVLGVTVAFLLLLPVEPVFTVAFLVVLVVLGVTVFLELLLYLLP